MRSVSEIRRENLLKVLDSNGLNRTDLAKLVGRSVQQISAVCTGYKPIGSKLAREIENFELRPLNTLYAPLRSDKVQIEVTGVVVESHKKYR